MTVPNFMSKAFSYQDLRREGSMWQKHPGADRVKGSPRIIPQQFYKVSKLIHKHQ